MSEEEKSGDENVQVKRDAILVVAYAERIECFIQYLKNQPAGDALEINGADQSTQSHYSINMVVKKGDNDNETVEIIYVKYQDNQLFSNLTIGDDVDVKYAFIGGDLCVKEDVRDFLVNCGVPLTQVFVTPCAYRIEANGDADCQKRKFKKTIQQRAMNILSKSDEKRQIDGLTTKYNVQFFNELVANSKTKECSGRPFILLQFPMLIYWSYKYLQQATTPFIKKKLIEMFTSQNQSLSDSLTIPAAQMFSYREAFKQNQGDNISQILPEVVGTDVIQSDKTNQLFIPEQNVGTQSVPEEKSDEQRALTIQSQTGGDLVGFDSKDNKNNCYLNALFQMLCRIKGLKEEMVDNLVNGKIPTIITNNNKTESPNPAFEIANIFQKYIQASLAQTSQTSQTVLFNISDVIGMKRKALLGDVHEAENDEQGFISFFLIKDTLCPNKGACIFDKYLGFNRSLSAYFFPLTDPNAGQTPSTPYKISGDIGSVVIESERKPYLIFYYERVVPVENTMTKASTNVTADGEINVGELKYVKKGAIVHLGIDTESGHYIYISYKRRDGSTYAIDKMYDNSNVIVFNDDGSHLLAPRPPNKKVVQFFEDSMKALIGNIQRNNQVDESTKNLLIDNFTKAEDTIKESDALKLLQDEDVNIFFEGMNIQMREIGNVINLSPGDIVNNFNDKPYANFLKKNVPEIEDLIAQNAVFFLYERVDASTGSSATAGGASTKKKKSWSRSRRMRKTSGQARVSLKRLNKMKQESHPSIKKRSTSLKK